MIKGKIVGLRAVEEKDLDQLKKWRNITSFRKNFREVRELNSVNQDAWLKKINSSSNDFMFVFVDLTTNEIIGAGGLLYINWIIRAADFSFYIGWKEKYIDSNGFAKEATELLIGYGFNNLNLNKIWMELYEFDKEKLEFFENEFNFKLDGVLRDNCFEEGKYWNSKIISLTEKDFNYD
ncbi:GNAT family N-acetyltransferase [Akkermansiaceae bacterium]|nr:GNAT family N-acetyltransferase [Akkermansiaceae bacterium]